MAKSKYEYVKLYETDDRLLPGCWIVVRLDGKGFTKCACRRLPPPPLPACLAYSASPAMPAEPGSNASRLQAAMCWQQVPNQIQLQPRSCRR